MTKKAKITLLQRIVALESKIEELENFIENHNHKIHYDYCDNIVLGRPEIEEETNAVAPKFPTKEELKAMAENVILRLEKEKQDQKRGQ